MITSRDLLIIKHIAQYGFITNSQARDLFISNHCTNASEIARRRLKAILDSGITFTKKGKPLLLDKNKVTNDNVFYYTTPPSYRDIQVMDIYAKLVSLGINVDVFKKPAVWLGGKVVSDAFLLCKFGDRKIAMCLEICCTSNDTNIKNYEELHKMNVLQSKLNGEFPKIVLVGHTGKIPSTFLDVIRINEDLSDINLLLE